MRMRMRVVWCGEVWWGEYSKYQIYLGNIGFGEWGGGKGDGGEERRRKHNHRYQGDSKTDEHLISAFFLPTYLPNLIT